MFTIIIVLIAVLDVEVTRLQILHHLREDAELKILAVNRRFTASRITLGEDQFPPLLGQPF
ncbi:hypothetical protein D9M70_478980 [compost metagenome]